MPKRQKLKTQRLNLCGEFFIDSSSGAEPLEPLNPQKRQGREIRAAALALLFDPQREASLQEVIYRMKKRYLEAERIAAEKAWDNQENQANPKRKPGKSEK